MNTNLIKLIKILLSITILSIFFNTLVFSLENKIILKINNKIITNIDINDEAIYLKALNPNLKNLDKEKLFQVAKTSLIREKIKEIELNKYYQIIIYLQNSLQNSETCYFYFVLDDASEFSPKFWNVTCDTNWIIDELCKIDIFKSINLK